MLAKFLKLLKFYFLFQLIICCLSASWLCASHINSEAHYQKIWCCEQQGIAEYRLDDGTRVDCLTDEYAIEFDFAPKWAESVGQSLYYAERTGKKAGVVLIMEHDGDERYFKRLNLLAKKYGIKLWKMYPDQLPNHSQ